MSRRALFIGVNDYGFAPLTSCVNDAMAMRDAVVGLALFDAAECTVMTSPAPPGGSSPTRKLILGWLRELYNAPQPIDRLLVFFAGHGLSVRLGHAADELRTALVPAGVETLADAGDELIDLDELIGRFARRGAREQFWIIDACRNLPEGEMQTVSQIGWNKAALGPLDVAQGALYAVAPLGVARGEVGVHGQLTRCVLDGLGFAGEAQWGAASYYDEADDRWHVDLRSLCDYAVVQIGKTIEPGSWEREFQLPRVWTSTRPPGSLRVVDHLANRPFVLRVEPAEAVGAVAASLSVRRNQVAAWPPRPIGQPVSLPPERYRLSAVLAVGSRGWALAPLVERVMDLRVRDEVYVRLIPTALDPNDVFLGAAPVRESPVFEAPDSTKSCGVGGGLPAAMPGPPSRSANLVVHAADPGATVRLTQLSGGRSQRRVPAEHSAVLDPGLWRVEVCLGNDVIASYEDDFAAGRRYEVSPMAQLTPAAAALMPDEAVRSGPTVLPSETIGPMQGAILSTLLPLLAVKPFDVQGRVLQRLAGRLAIPTVPLRSPIPAALALALDGEWPTAMPSVEAAIVELGGRAAHVWTGAEARIAVFVEPDVRARANARVRLPGLGTIDAAAPRLAGYCTTFAITLWPDGRGDVSISLIRLPIGGDQAVRPGKLSRALALASRLAATGASLLDVNHRIFELISDGKWGDPVLGALAWFGGQRWLAQHPDEPPPFELPRRQAAIEGYLAREMADFTDGRVIAALRSAEPAIALDALLDDPQLEPPVLADAVVALARHAMARGRNDHPQALRYQHLPRDAVFNVIRQPETRGP